MNGKEKMIDAMDEVEGACRGIKMVSNVLIAFTGAPCEISDNDLGALSLVLDGYARDLEAALESMQSMRATA